MKGRLALVSALYAALVSADQDVYIDGALSSGWENWSWSSTINFAATDLVSSGSSSMSVVADAWAALSLYDENPLANNFAGLRFDFAGDATQLQWYLQSDTDGTQSSTVSLSAIPGAADATATKFVTLTIDFSALPPSGAPLETGSWTRMNFQALGNGATYHLDNVELVSEIVVTPKFLSAEPLANNLVAVTSQGAVDFSTLSVKLNGSALTVANHTSYVPPDTPSRTITYLALTNPLQPGNLTISDGTVSFVNILPAVQYGAITVGNLKTISPLVYGVNFPKSAAYIQELGVTVSRWGGNAVTAYNPWGDFTNAGNDWYFENRIADDGHADDWLGWVSGAGSNTLLTVPALDWVSKDSTSYSYPKTIYPTQQAFDPYNANAGDGLLPNGSWVSPPDPTTVYTPWNTTLAKKWLTELTHKPNFVAIDNEMEIASNTHQDMHPIPFGYDEELARMVNYSTAIKSVLPDVQVFAPSTCAWWFYWTSSVGYTDNAAHGNMDWLPWFLQQMKAKSTAAGVRLLDYLDIHYYYAPDTSANDAAAKALRLRMTRSLWDPSYVDESWIGSNPQNHQPNPTAVWLIPRMQALINQYYPGTKLSISEWSSGADGDLTGGLLSVDVLGIYGRYGVDAATYWATPDEKGPIGLAYWLYRGFGTFFGDKSAQVNMALVNESVLGVYAAQNSSNKKLSVVIVNKDVQHVGLYLANVPHGKYFLRHFGGQAGTAKFQTNITITNEQYIIVPSYTAVFLLQQ